MKPDERETMFILCQRLAVEADRQKYAGYVADMAALLRVKTLRLEATQQAKSPYSAPNRQEAQDLE